MRKHPRALLLAGLVLLGIVSAPAHVRADDPDDPETDFYTRLLLELDPAVTIETIAERYGLTVLAHIPELRTWLVEVSPGDNADDVEDLMDNDDDILEAETEEVIETPEGDQRSIPDLGLVIDETDFLDQWGARRIHTVVAHVSHTGKGVTVAVLDTGIDPNAPLLAGALAGRGMDFVDNIGGSEPAPDGIDNDLDGFVDEGVHHGTFVAGLIRLAAPDATILPVRVLNSDGRGTLVSVVRGILFAVNRGADVINISSSVPRASELMEKATEYAADRGTVIVASAGNSGLPSVNYPAAFQDVIAVASVSETLEPSTFTNTGEEVVISAPGEQIFSSVVTESGYGGWYGTSFAAPLVSGGAAVLRERYPGLSTRDVRNVLLETAAPFPESTPTGMGAGILDLAALTQVLRADRDTVTIEKGTFGSVLRFSPVLGAQSYDIVRGDLDQLARNADDDDNTQLGTLTCLSNDRDPNGGLTLTDPTLPAPRRGFYYLFRDDLGGVQGYGEGFEGHRIPGPGDCAVD